MMKFIKEQWKFFTIIGLLTIMFVIFMSVSFAGSFKRYKWTYEGYVSYHLENDIQGDSTHWELENTPSTPINETVKGYEILISFDENQTKEKGHIKTEEEVENWFNKQGVVAENNYDTEYCYQPYTISYKWSKDDMIVEDVSYGETSYYVTDMNTTINYNDELTLESGY